MRAAIVLGLTMGLVAPAFAQKGEMPAKPAASCAAMDAALPAPLADWNGKAAISTAPSAEHLMHVALTLGKGYEANLLNTPKVAFPVQPEKPGGSVAFAGLFSFTVPEAGNYAVALGAAAWIDVLEDGKAVAPASFGHGPECTSIRKIVVFPLKAGVHTLQVSANADAKLKLMVAKNP
jgi:hypothetical protein